MAHYSFRKDLEDSKKGVEVAGKYLGDKYDAEYRVLGKEEQKNGDLFINTGDKGLYVEVKFDIMAAKTGNLCFEVDNGKKATGILATKAERIVYVVPQSKGYKLFIFGTANLLAYLSNINNCGKFRLVRGGDGKRFGMLLVSLSTIENDKVAEEIVECPIITTSVETAQE